MEAYPLVCLLKEGTSTSACHSCGTALNVLAILQRPVKRDNIQSFEVTRMEFIHVLGLYHHRIVKLCRWLWTGEILSSPRHCLEYAWIDKDLELLHPPLNSTLSWGWQFPLYCKCWKITCLNLCRANWISFFMALLDCCSTQHVNDCKNTKLVSEPCIKTQTNVLCRLFTFRARQHPKNGHVTFCSGVPTTEYIICSY